MIVRASCLTSGSDYRPDKLTLDRPAVSFFNFERASSFFFFDSATRSFLRIPISD
jgi:hypothetical protein